MHLLANTLNPAQANIESSFCEEIVSACSQCHLQIRGGARRFCPRDNRHNLHPGEHKLRLQDLAGGDVKEPHVLLLDGFKRGDFVSPGHTECGLSEERQV